MRKVVIAPDSFKGSLTARQAGEALAVGVRRGWPELSPVVVPMADGGEGTVQAIVDALGGEIHRVTVTGPLGRPVQAFYGQVGEVAVMEMASASGLLLLDQGELDPGQTTTYGTGELLRAALDAGAKQVLLGVGGSATNDGGAGFLQALGVRFLDPEGAAIPRGGLGLAQIHHVDWSDLDPRLGQIALQVASDVDNPLLGPHGASRTYGPQKGADPVMVEALEAALAHYADHLERDRRRVRDLPGAGAAGGLGFALLALGAQFRPGVQWVREMVGLREHLQGALFAITGEGSMDIQTLRGKVPMGVLELGQELGVPVVGVGGRIGASDELYEAGFASLVALAMGPMTLQESMAQGRKLLQAVGERVARLIFLGFTAGTAGKHEN